MGGDLRHLDLRGEKLQRIVLRDSDLRGTDLTAALLQGADFRGANLEAVALANANLEGADFRGADVSGVRFDTANRFLGVQLSGARMVGSSINGIGGKGSIGLDLSGSDFRNVDLERGFLARLNLDETDFRGARLVETRLRHFIDFRDADLSGIDATGLRNSGGRSVDLTRSRLIGTILRRADLPNTNLSDVDLTAADLTEARLDNSVLAKANLTDANLTRASLRGVNLNAVVFSNTTCPDGTNSDDAGGTCIGHLRFAAGDELAVDD